MADDRTAGAAPASVRKTTLPRALARLVPIPLLLASALGVRAAPGDPAGPFLGLHELDDVTTSHDERSIWIFWPAVAGEVRYAGYDPFRLQARSSGSALVGGLHVTCRSAAAGSSPAPPARAWVFLPMHPDAPSVPSVLNPLYWVLGLFAYEFALTPVRIRIAGFPAASGTLARKRIDYSVMRPDLELKVPSEPVLKRLSDTASLRLEVYGPGTAIVADFPARRGLVAAAEAVPRHCRPA